MTERGIPQGAGQRVEPARTPRRARGEFAENAPRIARRTIALDNARSDAEFDMTGTVLWAIDASDLDASVTVKFNSQDAQGVDFQRGLSIRGAPFGKLYISNDAQAGKSITFLYAVEETDRLEFLNPLIAFQNVKNDQPDTYTGSGDQNRATGGHDTIAARSDRREITVQADDGNTGAIFLRDSSGNAFAKLNAGDSATVVGTDAVQVRNDSGATQTYRYVEVRD